MSIKSEEAKKKWTDKASAFLVGRTIKSVRYLTQEECGILGWHSSAIVIELDNGAVLFPSRDDEGNDAGALYGQGADGVELTFPVIRS